LIDGLMAKWLSTIRIEHAAEHKKKWQGARKNDCTGACPIGGAL